VRLDNANGGVSGTSGFWPTFSPYTTTENGSTYYWIAFFSQRDYGNAQAGTKGTQRRQLWVTSVKAGATTVDPSSVAYWLPGQDTTSDNAAGRWAPTACRANAASCQVSSECCSGSCLPSPGDAALEPVPQHGPALRRRGRLLRGPRVQWQRVRAAGELSNPSSWPGSRR
jgi:hypothetical protein